MEVSPEIYAWLTSLNIIEPFTETEKNESNSFYIPENIVEALFEGHYFDVMILNLQDAYNKYFNKRKNCEPKLKELAFKEKKYDRISNKTKLNNWNVINNALQFFDLKYSKNDINKIMNKNNDMLLKVIQKIFTTINQLLKYTKKDYDFENINNSSNSYIKENKMKNNIDKNKKYSNNKNNSFEKTNKLLTPTKNNKSNNKNIDDNSNSKSLNDKSFKNINENNISNEINNKSFQDILSSKKPLTEYVDIKKLSVNTLYENCETALEFFIISLSKNFDIKPSESIGLLSNNRQYLSVLCKSGINGNYITIKKWLEDLQMNFDILLKLIMKYEDSIYMSYCIIGTALCSKNLDVSTHSIELLFQLYKNFGLNVPWFIKFGINSFIFVFIKHNTKISYFLNAMSEFIKSNEVLFFQEIKNNINIDSDYKTIILDLMPTLIPHVTKNNNQTFKKIFLDFLYDVCLHEESKLTYSSSIICETFFYFHDKIDDDIENKIILFFKKCIRSFCSNTYGSTIEKIFVLITKISKSYNQYAPGILKCLVSLFIDMYDDVIRREIFLINFENFLNEQKQVPLDIFFDPYINKIKTSNGYNLCDFNFLLKIIDHPRLGVKDIINIINFLLNVSIKKNVFNRCAIFVMEKILNEFYPNIKDQDQIKSISTILIAHINQVLDICLLNENEDINNEYLLEMSYIIIQYNIEEVKLAVKDKIKEFAKKYYNKYGSHSEICLGMLKKFEDFSNILNEIEKN